MVERRQVRSHETAAEVDNLTPMPEREDVALERLPGGLAPLNTLHDDLASELLDLAERQVAEARKKLGPQSSKPRLQHIAEMFATKAGKEPRVGEELERAMRSPALVAQIATLDGTFDHTLATGLNLFDKASVQSGAAVQAAYDDWTMAARIYKSEIRAGGAILSAAIEAANHPTQPLSYDTPLKAEPQVDHFTKADKIGTALLVYEKRMQAAAADLAHAYGVLMSALYGAVNALAVAEATLISVTQTANKTFWTNVQTAMSQIRS
jgi:hypothetical protein